MRKTGSGEDVRQHCGDPRVGIGLRGVVDPCLIGGLSAKERGGVGILLMTQHDESQIVKLLLTPVGNGYFRRAAQADIAGWRGERMRREIGYQAAAFRTADRRTPAV